MAARDDLFPRSSPFCSSFPEHEDDPFGDMPYHSYEATTGPSVNRDTSARTRSPVRPKSEDVDDYNNDCNNNNDDNDNFNDDNDDDFPEVIIPFPRLRTASPDEIANLPSNLFSDAMTDELSVSGWPREVSVELGEPRPPNEPEYVVERIVGHKVEETGDVYLLVKWAGYPSEENTYEPEKSFFAQLPQKVLRYWRLSGIEGGRRGLGMHTMRAFRILNQKVGSLTGPGIPGQPGKHVRLRGERAANEHQFLVHWVGCSRKSATWESAAIMWDTEFQMCERYTFLSHVKFQTLRAAQNVASEGDHAQEDEGNGAVQGTDEAMASSQALPDVAAFDDGDAQVSEIVEGVEGMGDEEESGGVREEEESKRAIIRDGKRKRSDGDENEDAGGSGRSKRQRGDNSAEHEDTRSSIQVVEKNRGGVYGNEIQDDGDKIKEEEDVVDNATGNNFSNSRADVKVEEQTNDTLHATTEHSALNSNHLEDGVRADVKQEVEDTFSEPANGCNSGNFGHDDDSSNDGKLGDEGLISNMLDWAHAQEINFATGRPIDRFSSWVRSRDDALAAAAAAAAAEPDKESTWAPTEPPQPSASSSLRPLAAVAQEVTKKCEGADTDQQPPDPDCYITHTVYVGRAQRPVKSGGPAALNPDTGVRSRTCAGAKGGESSNASSKRKQSSSSSSSRGENFVIDLTQPEPKKARRLGPGDDSA